MPEKFSVMIIQPNIFVYGGAERQIVELANYLTWNNHRVLIASTGFTEDFKRNLKEARILKCNNLEDLWKTCLSYQEKFSIINPHNHPAELMVDGKTSKTIWQMNEPPTQVLCGKPISKEEVKYVKENIHKAVVISDFEKKRFKKLYGFEPEVNYPAVRYEYFATTPNEIQKFDGFPILLQTGYFTFTKNQKFTVEIFSKVLEEYPNAKLILAGFDKDPYADEVKSKIKELNLESKIILLPYVSSDEEFKKLYYSADLFVNPILEQGGWATTFEAISAGIPTVVSKNFVGSNIVEKHNLGIVSDLENFYKSVMSAISDLKNLKERTLANRVWLKDNLTWNKFGERYEKLMEDVLNV